MFKRIIKIMLVLFIISGCYSNQRNITINMDLKDVKYTTKEYELDKKVSGVVIITKIYNLENKKESSNIKILIHKNEMIKEVFLSFTENYFIDEKCNDADCIKYLFENVFDLEMDSFINEALVPFEEIHEYSNEFIELRRKYNDYSGYVLFDLNSSQKTCETYNELVYSVENGNDQTNIYETKVYEIK